MSTPTKEEALDISLDRYHCSLLVCYSKLHSNLNKIEPSPTEDLGAPCPSNTGLATSSALEHFCLVHQLQPICLYDNSSLSLAHSRIASEPASPSSIIKTYLVISVKLFFFFPTPKISPLSLKENMFAQETVNF